MSLPICILACSLRAQGNSDNIANCFAKGVQSVGGTTEIIYLRNHKIMPCIACNKCFEHAQSCCIFEQQDDTTLLFQKLEKAPLVFLTAPIFFYHLPAHLKAFIDRAQSHFVKNEKFIKQNNYVKINNTKPAIVSMVAARERGEKLFEGSLLTLKYFLDVFNISIVDTCNLLGYDKAQDFTNDQVACAKLFELGIKAQKSLKSTMPC